MEYEDFELIVKKIREREDKIRSIGKLGIDLIDFDDEFHQVLNLLIKSIYGKEGLDWFSWFCNESEYGEKDWGKHDCYKMEEGKMVKIHDAGELRYGAFDEKENPICYSVQSTWEYLEKNHKK
jgi:hypothetical protein